MSSPLFLYLLARVLIATDLCLFGFLLWAVFVCPQLLPERRTPGADQPISGATFRRLQGGQLYSELRPQPVIMRRLEHIMRSDRR